MKANIYIKKLKPKYNNITKMVNNLKCKKIKADSIILINTVIVLR